jgi:imidazolonepropionase-like amidohydrolase
MFRAKNKKGYSDNILHFICHSLILCFVFLSLITRNDLVQAANQASDNSQQEIAIVGGTLIDGNGGAPLQNAVVLIKGNRIVRVGSKGKVKYAKSVKTIDATGKYVLPGLIDMHVHYFDWMGELFLAHGVTTVKDLGNDVEWMSTISSEVEQGKMRGPRIFYVGNGLDSPPPARVHYVGLESPAMAKRAVDLLHSRGVSAIKGREKLTPELLQAITGEAHKFGLPVTAHVRSIDAREAALAGVDGLEHATGITQAIANYPKQAPPGQPEVQLFISDLKAFSLIDPAKGEELMKFLASKHVALIPTMANWWRMASDRREDFAREDAEYAKNPLLAYVPDDIHKIWATSFLYNLKSADDLVQMQSGYKKLQALLMQHYQAGGKVLAGSDTFLSVPGLSLQRELLFLVDAGFTPMQAIVMATRDNAQFLGKGKELGTVAAGKLADIIVVSANPLEDIRNTQRIVIVIKDGQVVDTSYHPDYSIPTPKPKLMHPTWIERQLQSSEKAKAATR